MKIECDCTDCKWNKKRICKKGVVIVRDSVLGVFCADFEDRFDEDALNSLDHDDYAR